MRVSKTEKPYLDDPYTTRFTATILDTDAAPGGGQRVLLDRSYFYPESGGQTADVGRIGDLPVVDVQEGEGESVIHTVAGDAPPTGTVECTIDWGRRFDHMQQHTGQHVLSRAFIETSDLHTISFHMGEETCTIDVQAAGRSALDDDALAAAETLANRVVQENRPVTVRTVPVSELDADGLRRKVPEGVTDARLVDVAQFDVIPCCGTHVRATGELGLIKVLKWENVKSAQRVYFKVGRRALDDYTEKHGIVSALAARFTTAVAEVGANVDKVLAANQSAKKELRALSQRLAAFEARDLLAGAERLGGVTLVARRVDGDGGYARAVATQLGEHAGTVAVIGAADGTVVCAGADAGVAALAVERAKAAGGSGGGRGGFAQLRLPGDADVAAFIEGIAQHVRSSR